MVPIFRFRNCLNNYKLFTFLMALLTTINKNFKKIVIIMAYFAIFNGTNVRKLSRFSF